MTDDVLTVGELRLHLALLPADMPVHVRVNEGETARAVAASQRRLHRSKVVTNPRARPVFLVDADDHEVASG